MQKIKDFESFAAGYFCALGIARPSAKDVATHCIASRLFAAALSFYLLTNPRVITKESTAEKYQAVAENLQKLLEG